MKMPHFLATVLTKTTTPLPTVAALPIPTLALAPVLTHSIAAAQNNSQENCKKKTKQKWMGLTKCFVTLYSSSTLKADVHHAMRTT